MKDDAKAPHTYTMTGYADRRHDEELIIRASHGAFLSLRFFRLSTDAKDLMRHGKRFKVTVEALE